MHALGGFWNWHDLDCNDRRPSTELDPRAISQVEPEPVLEAGQVELADGAGDAHLASRPLTQVYRSAVRVRDRLSGDDRELLPQHRVVVRQGEGARAEHVADVADERDLLAVNLPRVVEDVINGRYAARRLSGYRLVLRAGQCLPARLRLLTLLLLLPARLHGARPLGEHGLDLRGDDRRAPEAAGPDAVAQVAPEPVPEEGEIPNFRPESNTPRRRHTGGSESLAAGLPLRGHRAARVRRAAESAGSPLQAVSQPDRRRPRMATHAGSGGVYVSG